MDKYVCVDYLCSTQTKLYITSKGQGFENRTYNAVSGIGIPELLLNIISCHVFVNNTKSDFILSCRRQLVDNYIQNILFFMKTIQMPLRIFFYV